MTESTNDVHRDREDDQIQEMPSPEDKPGIKESGGNDDHPNEIQETERAWRLRMYRDGVAEGKEWAQSDEDGPFLTKLENIHRHYGWPDFDPERSEYADHGAADLIMDAVFGLDPKVETITVWPEYAVGFGDGIFGSEKHFNDPIVRTEGDDSYSMAAHFMSK